MRLIETAKILERNLAMNITVRVTNNYGSRAVYPACETSRKLADLIGTKTFTHAALQKIESLGYVISVQPQTL